MQKLYAGIGPRKTPTQVLGLLTTLSHDLSLLGWKLRSGKGKGADQAFEVGTSNKEIWLPCLPFNGQHFADDTFKVSSRSAIIRQIAAEYHSHYSTCSDFIQSLFDRNVNIILGDEAADPVSAVIYWHEADNDMWTFGGTNHSLRIAAAYNIPAFNVELEYDRQKLQEFISNVS